MAGKGAPLRCLQSVRTAEAEQFLMKSRWGAERSGEIKKKMRSSQRETAALIVVRFLRASSSMFACL